MKYKYFGHIKKGNFHFEQRDRIAFDKYTSGLKEGTPIWLSLSIARKSRSNNQNRYYFGVIIDILSDYFGYSTLECHEVLKWQFLRIVGENGKPDSCKSTTELDTMEFEVYLNKVREWASTEYEIYLPLPNEIDLPEYIEIYK